MLPLCPRDGRAAVLGGGDLVAHRGEERVEGLTDIGLVVDHQDPLLGGRERHGPPSASRGASLVGAGSHMKTVVPTPRSLSMWMSPWCSSKNRRVIESPRPVPRPGGLVVKKGSKTWVRCSASIPHPLSRTSISTPGSAPLASGRASMTT